MLQSITDEYEYIYWSIQNPEYLTLIVIINLVLIVYIQTALNFSSLS